MSRIPVHRIGELRVGVAVALDLFDPPNELDEELLARAVRAVASDVGDLGYRMFLDALAAAFDDPDAEMRLSLKKSRRGRSMKGPIPRALTIGPYVEKLVERGWKKEAAVQQAMSDMALSRSTVMRSCAEYSKLSLPFKAKLDSDDF